jgi:hypothetical protein
MRRINVLKGASAADVHKIDGWVRALYQNAQNVAHYVAKPLDTGSITRNFFGR